LIARRPPGAFFVISQLEPRARGASHGTRTPIHAPITICSRFVCSHSRLNWAIMGGAQECAATSGPHACGRPFVAMASSAVRCHRTATSARLWRKRCDLPGLSMPHILRKLFLPAHRILGLRERCLLRRRRRCSRRVDASRRIIRFSQPLHSMCEYISSQTGYICSIVESGVS
jgi:hypothetical protein